MADPIIKIGSTGEAVKKAQQALYCRRYLVDLSEVDGVFGPITRNRVIRYQLDRSVGEFSAFSFPLTVDGIVGPMTWSRLTPPLIKKGSKGNPVFLVQEILKSWGYPDYDPGPIDGDFGKLTETAVMNVQSILTDCDNAPLKVDGIVGPKTWTALYSRSSAATTPGPGVNVRVPVVRRTPARRPTTALRRRRRPSHPKRIAAGAA